MKSNFNLGTTGLKLIHFVERHYSYYIMCEGEMHGVSALNGRETQNYRESTVLFRDKKKYIII